MTTSEIIQALLDCDGEVAFHCSEEEFDEIFGPRSMDVYLFDLGLWSSYDSIDGVAIVSKF